MEEKMAKVQYPATVLSFLRKRGFGYVRQWVVPAPSEQNLYYGFKIYNLSRIWYFTSKQYKSDLRIYASFWASLDYQVEFLKKRSSNPFSIFFHIFLKFEALLRVIVSHCKIVKTHRYIVYLPRIPLRYEIYI